MLTLFQVDGGANLILYWRVRGGSLELGLCKPRGLWRFRGTPKLEWQLPVTFDPLAGLKFVAADDEDLQVPLRFEEPDYGEGDEPTQ